MFMFNEDTFIDIICSKEPKKYFQLTEQEKKSGDYIFSTGEVIKNNHETR